MLLMLRASEIVRMRHQPSKTYKIVGFFSVIIEREV